MSRRTKGPWKSEGNSVTTGFGETGICILEPLESFWCGDVLRHPTHQEMEANSRLIAAAPAILEALQFMREAVAEIRWAEWPTKGLGIGVSPEHMDALLRKADADMDRVKRKERKA